MLSYVVYEKGLLLTCMLKTKIDAVPNYYKKFLDFN